MKGAAAALALALLATGPAAAQSTAPDAGRAEARGDSLMGAFRTMDAVAAYRAGLASAPDDPTLLWKAARALANRADETPGYTEEDEHLLESADSLARRGVAAGPDVARTHTVRAEVLGRYGRVLAHRHRIADARKVIRMGREAYDQARKAIELDPSDFAPFAFLGAMAREIATVNPVVKTIAETFLDHYPDVTLEDSARFLRRAKALAPNDVTTRLELGKTYLAMDRKADARAELRAALSLPPVEELDRVEQKEAGKILAAHGGGG